MNMTCVWMVPAEKDREGEISGYFLQAEDVGLTDRFDTEGIKERGIKEDSCATDLWHRSRCHVKIFSEIDRLDRR